MLEFTLDGNAPAGLHRMRTGAGSVLEFADNGARPPARLVVLYGARCDRSVPVTVLERDDAGRPVLVRLPGGAGGRVRFAPLDQPAADRAEAVLLVPIAQLPTRPTIRFVDDGAAPPPADHAAPRRDDLPAPRRHDPPAPRRHDPPAPRRDDPPAPRRDDHAA